MIDTVSLVWGDSLEAAARYPERPSGKRGARPLSPPVRLELGELAARLGSADGELRSIRYGAAEGRFGHWKFGGLDLLYTAGRLELRASLPKLVSGRNDAVLDEQGVREGLRELVRAGNEAIAPASVDGRPLELRDARPTRLDYCYQWPVDSVAAILDELRARFRDGPRDRLRYEVTDPRGGRSLIYGYGSKRVTRWYDKGAEVTASGLDELPLDKLLRFEIQDRRSPRLRLVHERGYRAGDVRRELADRLEGFSSETIALETALERAKTDRRFGIALPLACYALAKNPELEPLLRESLTRRNYYKWRRRSREVLHRVEWRPSIPADAFAKVQRAGASRV